MLNLFKSKKSEIYAPIIKGEVIALENVPDNVFASKMMGEGVGFENFGNSIVSPVDGTVIMLFPTKHAIGIQTKEGIEILIHIGLDTVQLNGVGFESHVEKGSKIKRGDLLITYDIKIMEENNINLITPMVITNCDEFEISFNEIKQLEGQQLVMTCAKK